MEDSKLFSLIVLGSVALVSLIGLVMIINSDSITGASLRQFSGKSVDDISMHTALKKSIGECRTPDKRGVEPIFTLEEKSAKQKQGWTCS